MGTDEKTGNGLKGFEDSEVQKEVSAISKFCPALIEILGRVCFSFKIPQSANQ